MCNIRKRLSDRDGKPDLDIGIENAMSLPVLSSEKLKSAGTIDTNNVTLARRDRFPFPFTVQVRCGGGGMREDHRRPL
jgi:hypothetical protein